MAIIKLNGTASASLSVRVGDDNYNEPRNNLNQPVVQSYSFGSDVGEADAFYSSEITVLASGTTTLTLDDASLRDLFGNLVSLDKIGVIRVQHSGNSSASTVDLGGTILDAVCASGGTFSYKMGPSDYFNIGTNRDQKSLPAGATITITNNDVTESATVSVDVIGISD